MNRVDITQQLLPMYLAVVMLLLIPLQVLSVLAILVPLILISFGLYRKNKNVGIAGMVVFALLSFTQIVLLLMDDIVRVFLLVFFVVLPSVLLLGQVLQMENIQTLWFPTEKKKPLMITGVLLIFIFIVFYVATMMLQGVFLFSTTTTSGQLFLLAAISIILCVPVLLQ
jgi:hypothetical protein